MGQETTLIVSPNNCYHAATGSSSICYSPKVELSLSHLAMAALRHNFFLPLESSMKPHPDSPPQIKPPLNPSNRLLSKLNL